MYQNHNCPTKQTSPRKLLKWLLILPLLVLYCGAIPALADQSPRKPPVVPTDGKPLKIMPLPNKSVMRTMRYRLRHDRRLDGRHIRVVADGPRVVLLGSVPNYFQRRIAREIAQGFWGVNLVDDRLRVLSTPRSANEIEDQIRRKIAQNAATAGQGIKVKVQRDVVTLTATVDTLYAKTKAIRLAMSTPRVSTVQDHLTVRAAGSGEELAARVHEALRRHPLAVQRPLRVVSTNSYVSVRGGAYTRQAKEQVWVIASMVPGVTGLDNEVVVLPKAVRKYWRSHR